MEHIRETHASPLAISYAQSVLDLANAAGQAEAIGEGLAGLKQIVDENPSFREVLINPSIGEDERAQLLERIFRSRIYSLLFNTLGVLNQHGRLGLIDQIATAYDDLLDEQLGKIEVDLTVAQRLSAEQLEQARQRISAALGRDVIVHQYIDDGIIGGMIVRVGDKLIDASVRQQLSAIREQFLAAAPS
jgi:F-type H+-transporting ATPase subunit delta